MKEEDTLSLYKNKKILSVNDSSYRATLNCEGMWNNHCHGPWPFSELVRVMPIPWR